MKIPYIFTHTSTPNVDLKNNLNIDIHLQILACLCSIHLPCNVETKGNKITMQTVDNPNLKFISDKYISNQCRNKVKCRPCDGTSPTSMS